MEANSLLSRTLSDGAANLDLLDQLLSGEGWLEFPNSSAILQANTPNSMSPFDSLSFSPLFEVSNGNSTPVLPESDNPDDTDRSVISTNPPSDESQVEKIDRTQSLNSSTMGGIMHSVQSGELSTINPSPEPGTNWWIRPSNSISSVKDRFMHALGYIKETHREGNVLVQLWVPMKRGDQLVLTTYGQPFLVDPNCEKLVNYREISTNYEFSAEENSGRALGLPGRVFLGRLPEWTPDVRYFDSSEFPRVGYAQWFDVRGTIALPVFEPGGRSCLGVVEVVTTTQNMNHSSELQNICNALQAVDLTSSEVLSVPHLKVSGGSYQAGLPEIVEVLKTICKMHKLPLAQTWIACIRQGKRGSRHSMENYKDCISTVDAACYVNDPSMLSFHRACSEHHLLKGQGVAGKAFTTNEPCFSPDITASCKTEYPLSHHARMVNLKGAVAIRLRSIRTGNADFVFELFLPPDCIESEEQKLMLSSLSNTIQQVCQTLRVVTIKELEDEAMLQVNELIPSELRFGKSGAEEGHRQNVDDVLSVEASEKETSRFLELEKDWFEGFTVTTHSNHPEVVVPAGEIFSEFNQHCQDLQKDVTNHKDSFASDCSFLVSGKATEKRRTKTEKTVSLEVLRQHFAGRLKDAAKTIGVCPTTLKRICRQHGITRWPSRKIKKVDHSLKKLQVVIDSVHGADKGIQLSSLYKAFNKTSGPSGNLSGSITFSPVNQKDHPESAHQQQDARFRHHLSSSSHSSSSCSQGSSSSHSCSSGAKQSTQAAEFIIKQESSMEESPSGIPERTNSRVDLSLPTQETTLCINRSENHKSPIERCSSGTLPSLDKDTSTWIRVKAMYGAEKVRLRLQPTWGFQDLKQEITKRFNIGDTSSVNLKYLDDDTEWILLTCDADLQECIHVYRSSGAEMIKISVQSVGLSQ
ncbi:protein NLP1 [Cocos nucifera]|uniref:Protein NLP1 n=1 Tax=Cocos nucifera TaxID=13894 RepID=A0A8K0IJN7_COCNU|nr:protein NLP1 [Cocos nucifera]